MISSSLLQIADLLLEDEDRTPRSRTAGQGRAARAGAERRTLAATARMGQITFFLHPDFRVCSARRTPILDDRREEDCRSFGEFKSRSLAQDRRRLGRCRRRLVGSRIWSRHRLVFGFQTLEQLALSTSDVTVALRLYDREKVRRRDPRLGDDLHVAKCKFRGAKTWPFQRLFEEFCLRFQIQKEVLEDPILQIANATAYCGRGNIERHSGSAEAPQRQRRRRDGEARRRSSSPSLTQLTPLVGRRRDSFRGGRTLASYSSVPWTGPEAVRPCLPRRPQRDQRERRHEPREEGSAKMIDRQPPRETAYRHSQIENGYED